MVSLLSEIELFMEAHSLSPTAFGQLALGDRRFVKELRGEYKGKRPRRVWPETEAKVREFMLTYKPQKEAA
jgi:hypothetical protein